MTFLSALYNGYKRLTSSKIELGSTANAAAKLAEQIKVIDKQISPFNQKIQKLEEAMKQRNSPEIQNHFDTLVADRQKLLDQRMPLAKTLLDYVQEVKGLRTEVYSGEPTNTRPSSSSSLNGST